MKYLSVCSGIEAASVAWHGLGWQPQGFSEIEPFPSAVLKHHFPNVKNFGDMTRFKEWPIEPGSIDLLVGGTPCQSFSVAGLRGGLADPRGNVMLTFGAIADHLKPSWIVWENVPAVAFTVSKNSNGFAWESDVSPTIDTSAGKSPNQQYGVRNQFCVRRLMPVECERLQGFPDDWTKIPTWNGWRKIGEDEMPAQLRDQGLEVRQSKNGKWRVKDVDGPRYKAIGNSMAVPVMAWIGRRIELVEKQFSKQEPNNDN